MPEFQEPLPPPPKKGMLSFGKAPEPQGPDFSGITNDVNTISRRLRLLEEGFSNLRRFFQVTEESIINKNKHFSSEIKTINSDILEVRKEIQELRDKTLLIIRELQTVARKEEVKILEKYINFWNPIKFVTVNEVEQIFKEIMERENQPKKTSEDNRRAT
ncbi:MAG TPA: hypothetical protein VI564_00580 [Candidatus Nanoarchaeia archaeon]|nr:hypothetical protein [Candidatus Nanoarchaeia archaeon]